MKNKELLKDAFNFMKRIGGAIELCDRGWKPEIGMDSYYMEDIQKLLNKYLPEEENTLSINTIDDCLLAEHLLENYFTKTILNKMIEEQGE